MPLLFIAVRVLCAWCQAEGKSGLLRVVDAPDGPEESHGICEAHMRELLAEARARRQS
jgi:hypothetical protein